MFKALLKNKKKLIFGLIAILLVIAMALYFLKYSGTQNQTESQPTNNDNFINLSPPTEQDKKSVDENKERLVSEETVSKDEQENNVTKSANPVVIDAGKYGSVVEVRSMVPNVVENGGVCKYSFIQDSQSLSFETSAFADAKTTNCTPLSVDGAQFNPGIWKLVVSYASSTTSGKSEVKEVNIQ